MRRQRRHGLLRMVRHRKLPRRRGTATTPANVLMLMEAVGQSGRWSAIVGSGSVEGRRRRIGWNRRRKRSAENVAGSRIVGNGRGKRSGGGEERRSTVVFVVVVFLHRSRHRSQVFDAHVQEGIRIKVRGRSRRHRRSRLGSARTTQFSTWNRVSLVLVACTKRRCCCC